MIKKKKKKNTNKKKKTFAAQTLNADQAKIADNMITESRAKNVKPQRHDEWANKKINMDAKTKQVD